MGHYEAGERSFLDRCHCVVVENHVERGAAGRLDEAGGNENGPLVGGAAGSRSREPGARANRVTYRSSPQLPALTLRAGCDGQQPALSYLLRTDFDHCEVPAVGTR